MNLDHNGMSVALTIERLDEDDEIALRLYGDGEQLGTFGSTEPASPYETAVAFAGYNGVVTDLPKGKEVVLWSQGPEAVDAVDFCRECDEVIDDAEAHETHTSPQDYFHIEVKA